MSAHLFDCCFACDSDGQVDGDDDADADDDDDDDV